MMKRRMNTKTKRKKDKKMTRILKRRRRRKKTRFPREDMFLYLLVSINSSFCGSGMFIPEPNFFHARFRIRIFSIPDSALKNLIILTQNIVTKLSEI